MAKRTSKSFYLLEISVRPGAARRGELHVYRAPEHILAILRQEAALCERMWAESALALVDVLGVWSVHGETLQTFVDLRPFVSFRAGRGKPFRWEEGRRTVESVEGSEDIHVDVDSAAVLSALPKLQGELACPGDRIRLKKRRKGNPKSYVQFVLEEGEELHYGWNDVEAGDPPPEDFVDPDPPPPPPDPLAGNPDADFLRRIYLSPEDDAPRAAYAVVLAAREDPRGEFIALQLARARGESVAAKRESQLLAKHATQWGSPILDEVDRQAFCRTWDDARSVPAKRYDGVRFERGFLSHVSMFRNTIRTAGYFDHPAWSTVRNIAWTPVVSEAMRSLQDVGGPSSILKQVAKRSRPLCTVRVGPRPGPWPGGPEPYPEVKPGALRIRRFIVYQPQGLPWVERILSMSPRVEFIELRGLDLDQVADWDWSPIDRASALRSIEISSLTSMHRIDASVTLARGEAGWVADIVARGDPSDLWQLMLAVEKCFVRRPVRALSFALVGLHENDPSPVGDGAGRSIPRYHDSLTAGIAEKLAAVADRVSVVIRLPEELR